MSHGSGDTDGGLTSTSGRCKEIGHGRSRDLLRTALFLLLLSEANETSSLGSHLSDGMRDHSKTLADELVVANELEDILNGASALLGLAGSFSFLFRGHEHTIYLREIFFLLLQFLRYTNLESKVLFEFSTSGYVHEIELLSCTESVNV